MGECERIQDRMLDYFDGKLDADQVRAMKRHLESCEACRTLFEDMEALLQAEKTLPNEIPADLHEQIMGAVRWDARLARLRARARRRAWVAAACACLILFGAGTVSVLRLGAAESQDNASEMITSDSAAPEFNQSATQDTESDSPDSGEESNGATPQEDGDMESATQDDADGTKSEMELFEQDLDAIVTAFEADTEYACIVLCDTPDLGDLKAVCGEPAVQVEGFSVFVLEADIFETLLAQEMLLDIQYYETDGQSYEEGAQVLVVLRS